MFEDLEVAPPDAIFGLQEEFKRDPNPAKIDLTVGVYQDAEGVTPIFRAVKRAEARLIETETDKSYLSIEGSPEYSAIVKRLLFGPDHEVVVSNRAATAHTPGGTGALRIAADLIKSVRPGCRIWVSQPTWPNHPNVFSTAGLDVETYPYFDAATNDLAAVAMLAALSEIPVGDVLLLHGCCHNPTGVDPTPEQWELIADVVQERGLLPLVDFAYQGLADGIHEDATGIRALCRPGSELLIANSFSKNFGLYRERVGALTAVTASRKAAEAVLSHIKRIVRANYSNPPSHGAAIVSTIMNDLELHAEWEEELTSMRARIKRMRTLFVEKLAAEGVPTDFSFIERQRGMFSFSGLTRQQAEALRQRHSVYILNSGRVNVAGLNEANVGAVCRAIAGVV